jgi:multidrug efflux pump subunit AcrA (membrane-fusion protein)
MKHIILLLTSLMLLFSCKKSDKGTVHPVNKDIAETVFASGILDPDDKYFLTTQSEGYLLDLNFKEGDLVKTNQLLAVVDNKTNTANVQAAVEQLRIANLNATDNAPTLKQLKANIDFAEQKLKQDQQQLQRYKLLFESNSVSKVEYENIQLAAQNSETSLNSLQQQYASLKLQAEQQQIIQSANTKISSANSAYNMLRAIAGGMILKRNKQSGDYVKKGDVIATIGNSSTIIARLNVDENSISKVKIGQKATVQLNVSKDKTYAGTVAEILPMFDESTQSFVCKVKFDKPLDFTITGTQLEANILVGEKKNALLIPRSYLGFGSKVQVKGQDKPIEIKTGIVSTDWVEVLSGLTLRDEIEPLKP